jgi:hypothetical protein
MVTPTLGRMAEVALTIFAKELANGLIRIVEKQVKAKPRRRRRGRKRSR